MRFILLNDLEYLLHKRKKILGLILFLPLFHLLLNISVDIPSLSLLKISMGIAVDFKRADIIEILLYLFNIFIFIFLFMDVYIKDFLYQIDNLFMRIPFYKWYCKKSILFVGIIFLIKILQYTFLCVILFVLKEKFEIFSLVQLFIKDYLYIIFLQYCFFLVYILMIIGRRLGKIGGITLFLIVTIVIPKNISSISLLMFLWIFLLQVILFFLFKKIPKKIIENI